MSDRKKNVREGGVACEKRPPRDCRAPADLSSAPLATVSFYRSIGKTAGVPDAVKEAGQHYGATREDSVLRPTYADAAVNGYGDRGLHCEQKIPGGAVV